VEGGGVGPPAHPKHFGESPLLWSDAVAIISAMCEAFNHSSYSNFAGLRQLFRLLPPEYVYPDCYLF
jgi:hypothetical protein